MSQAIKDMIGKGAFSSYLTNILHALNDQHDEHDSLAAKHDALDSLVRALPVANVEPVSSEGKPCSIIDAEGTWHGRFFTHSEVAARDAEVAQLKASRQVGLETLSEVRSKLTAAEVEIAEMKQPAEKPLWVEGQRFRKNGCHYKPWSESYYFVQSGKALFRFGDKNHDENDYSNLSDFEAAIRSGALVPVAPHPQPDAAGPFATSDRSVIIGQPGTGGLRWVGKCDSVDSAKESASLANAAHRAEVVKILEGIKEKIAATMYPWSPDNDLGKAWNKGMTCAAGYISEKLASLKGTT